MANFNFNKVILGGRLTADPELKSTEKGDSVTSFNVAVSRRGQDAGTDFINCTAWRKTAELITSYFKKGSSICIVGRIQTRSWKDKEGNKRYATDVVVDEVNFVDSKGENPGGSYAPVTNDAPTADAPTYEQPQFEEITDDDELPF